MAGYCAKMSLVPFSTLLRVTLGSSVRSLVQLKLTKNFHWCHLRSSRNFGSSSAFLCSAKEDGWQQWYSTVPSTVEYKKQQLAHKENVSKVKKGTVMIRDSDTSLVKEISLIRGATEILEFIENIDPQLFDDRVLEVTSKCLFNYLKTDMSVADKKNLLSSVGMQKFCRLFKKQSRFTQPTTLISVCKIFSLLNVPGNHPTFQITLRLLSKHANTLPISQIIYLDFLMEKFDPISRSPLTEALTLALPIIFEGQLKLQLNVTSGHDLLECLDYIVKYDLSDKAVKTVIDAVTKCRFKLNEHEAFSFLWLLGESKHSFPEAEEFVNSLFKIMTVNLHKFSSRKISTLVGKCIKKHLVNGSNSYWYNEDFVESICNRVIEFSDDTVIRCFKSVSLWRHVNLDLMEAVAEYVVKDPTVILNNDVFFFTILRGLSAASYKPEKWDILQRMLVEHPALTKDLGIQDISLALDFLALDILPSNLISKVFVPNNVHNLERWFKGKGSSSLLLVLNAVRHLHPEYDGPLPPPELIGGWESFIRKRIEGKVRPIEAALQTGLGGSAYVLSDVVHDGLCIDHCIVMGQGGYPVSVQDTEPLSLDHIETPSNSSLILIKVYGLHAYSSNTNRLRGIFSMESKIWRSYGHPLIEIDLIRWNEMPDVEKIPWLMQKIREHTDVAPHNSY